MLETAGCSVSFNYGDERVGDTSTPLKDFHVIPESFVFLVGETVSDADEVNNKVSTKLRSVRGGGGEGKGRAAWSVWL